MPDNRRILRWVVIAGLIGAFLVLDYGIAREFGSPDWIMAAALGVCVGQVNLIAAWAALAPGNVIVRLPWSLLLGLAMWYVLVAGNRDRWPNYSLSDALLLGMFVLGGVVILQIPLWIAARVFRLRLLGAEDSRGVGRLQFNLRHLLVATALLSVALAPLRVVLPSEPIGEVHLQRAMPAVFAAAAICNMIVTVPCIFGAFLRAKALVPLALGWLVYCAVVTGLEIAVLTAFLGPPGPREAPMFYVANVAQCATVFGVMLVLRALGFRLVRDGPEGAGDGGDAATGPQSGRRSGG